MKKAYSIPGCTYNSPASRLKEVINHFFMSLVNTVSIFSPVNTIKTLTDQDNVSGDTRRWSDWKHLPHEKMLVALGRFILKNRWLQDHRFPNACEFCRSSAGTACFLRNREMRAVPMDPGGWNRTLGCGQCGRNSRGRVEQGESGLVVPLESWKIG